MDPSQQPHQPEQISSETYTALPSSQIQAPSYVYDPNQSAYAYYPPPYQYAYYDASQQAAYDYSNAYYQQPQQQAATSTHPTGAQFQPQPQSEPPAAAAHYQYTYYPPPQPHVVEYGGVCGSVVATHSGTSTAQVLQPSHAKRGGRVFRGGVRGRGGKVQPQNRSSGLPPSAPVWPPPRMAWCELCRVECNSPEILEQHKSGKKHLKNVKVQEELQRVVAAGHHSSQVNPEPVHHQLKETEDSGGKLSSVETVNGRSEQLSQGRGLKRKIRGGRGGKSLRRKPAEPAKPRGAIPLICELCNVTCETQMVFQSHLKGKKHLANRKRFEQSEAVFGQAAAQALYPTLQTVHQQTLPADPSLLTQSAPLVFHQVQVASTLTPAPEAVLNPPPMVVSQGHQDPNLQCSKPVDEGSTLK